MKMLRIIILIIWLMKMSRIIILVVWLMKKTMKMLWIIILVVWLMKILRIMILVSICTEVNKICGKFTFKSTIVNNNVIYKFSIVWIILMLQTIGSNNNHEEIKLDINLTINLCWWIQWWNIFNWTLRNKLQWNLNRNSYILVQENAFENVACQMATILSRPQCVNPIYTIAFVRTLKPRYWWP